MRQCLGIFVGGVACLLLPWRWVTTGWAESKRLLPKGFPKKKLIRMNPAELDSRNLEIDPLSQFGTMGPTDISIDVKTYRLKVSGKVERPLSLAYEEILSLPTVKEEVLLICPGFFANNGYWGGVALKTLLDEARLQEEAKFAKIKGGRGKVVRIPLKDMDSKRILLAYRVNEKTLPKKHGYPLRLVYEDAYGSDWVKYVDEVVIS